ncbi:DUF1501 domain-containing protein [Blastopirellula retiformator]|uniref:Sulfatase n=1 Tax=Blastopirellula retiformator TaxID=2527970 RepID=A0A5C5V6J0_9BACT|nr:DUF1501 domain-containing protein [Blastopirellula retiformator]TWT34204.1 hypothetical protein Enr8_15980 [Blastopirellula retiformator]
MPSTVCQQHGVPHHEQVIDRRQALLRTGAGFGSLALSWMMAQESRAAHGGLDESNQMAHVAPRAKNVIFLFMEGGPSHIDLFDPKPTLNKLHGQQLPSSFKKVILAMGEGKAPLYGSPRKWKQHGESGLWISEWLPHIAEHADDLAVIRSCHSDGINHAGGVCQMNTGAIIGGRPSLGSWVSYGLGTENENLPAFVVLQDNNGTPVNGPRNWGTAFMPAVYQGTRFHPGETPIRNLENPKGITDPRQQSKLAYLNQMNQGFAHEHPGQSELDARIKSYELAFRMQVHAPEAIDLTQETEETKQLYGMDDKATETFGRNCLLARRLVERGVRFVQLYHGTGSKWDAHNNIEKNHSTNCRSSDKPVAGLLADLKRRGLLDDTLVVWGGEFGRTPMSEQGNGRDHNPSGFTMWFAGGGVRGGQTIGSTDEIGLHAVEDRMHVHSLHASILYLMGLDNMKLTYFHKGRPERPTVNEGEMNMKLVTG